MARQRVAAALIFLVVAVIVALAVRVGGPCPNFPLGLAAAACAGAAASGALVPGLTRLDWRIVAIIAATLAAWAATCLGFAYGLEAETYLPRFVHDVFGGWLASVIFATTVGLVVAVVSVASPEDDNFEARASILFQGQTGKHVDYIVAQLKQKFEHYSESVIYHYTIKDYHPGEQKFQLSSKSDTILRSYLTDVETSFRAPFELLEASAPPPGKPVNRLLYLTVDGETVASSDFQNNSLREMIETRIPKGGSCKIEAEMEYWVCAEAEENTWKPSRYTIGIRTYMRNALPDKRAITIRVMAASGGTPAEYKLACGNETIIWKGSDMPPAGRDIYDFRLLPLT